MTDRRHTGRGRPVVFDAAARTVYLAALRSGASMADAATAAGITARGAQKTAAADPAFAAARKQAAAAGKTRRIEELPHDEYRYNHHRCRCDVCTKAATEARAGRRGNTSPTASVTPIPTAPTPRTGGPFPLAAAS